MKRITFVLLAVASVVGVVALFPTASGRADETVVPVFRTEVPQGYRDLSLISVSRLTAGDGRSQRAELGNDIAIKAYREGNPPFPDGSIVAALHWSEVSSKDNNQVLAMGFPGAGARSFVPGPALNVQLMIKDSKK